MATLSSIAKGIEILSQYVGEDSHSISAEHDVILVGPESVQMPQGDDAELRRLGWFISGEYGCWAHFV